jgi:hypothetical protein
MTLFVSGSSSAVERQLPKLDVAGSIPVSRSIILSVQTKFVMHLIEIMHPNERTVT